jgi:hypothetical protein
MDTKRALIRHPKYAAAQSALAGLFAGVLILMSALAAAQDGVGPKAREDQSFFGSIGRWFNEQAENINSTFKDAGKKFETFGRDAGVAAKTTAESAKDAADAMARIPKARVMSGHEKCNTAPNGAPDCLAAANTLCKAKGFEFGKSTDMTTAVVCPPKVLLSGRNSGPECRDETFVSRAICQ